MKRLLVALVAFAGVLTLHAGEPSVSPLQLSICPPAQIMPEDTDIIGLKLNLPYGHNQYVSGVDMGVVGGAERCEALQLNLFNVVPDRATGVIVGLFNLTGGAEGIHCAALNLAAEDCIGMQVGLLNTAREVTGLQIGAVNRCDSLRGIQIGVANIAMDAPLPFMVLINAAF